MFWTGKKDLIDSVNKLSKQVQTMNKELSKVKQDVNGLKIHLLKTKDELGDIRPQLDNTEEKINQLQPQLVDTNDKVQKLSRLNYKAGQENQMSLKNIDQKIEEMKSWQDIYEHFLASNRQIQSNLQQLGERLIAWLDNIDHICSDLDSEKEEEQTWHRLLNKWSEELIEMLAAIGIKEIKVKGQIFDSQWAEAVKTVTKEEAAMEDTKPYQIVDIVQRGFIYNNDNVLRKAKVVTIKEGEDIYEQCQ